MSGAHQLIQGEAHAQRKPESVHLKIRHLEGLVREVLSEVEAVASAPGGSPTIDLSRGVNLREEVRRYEISLIVRALRLTGGHQRRAAALLGMKATTLNMKVKLYNLLPQAPPARGGQTPPHVIARRSG